VTNGVGSRPRRTRLGLLPFLGATAVVALIGARLGWVGFAGVLNGVIIRRNRTWI
jgi:hypothetical protein